MTVKGFSYDEIVQDALRGAVRNVLDRVSKEGLTGSHHFYLTFQTDRPDVIMPEDLRVKHPKEITIVLQHQFWDLKVEQHKFEVTLSFNDSPEKIVVPFGSLISFLDPSVKFGLQFVPTQAPVMEKKGRVKTKDKDEHEESTPGSTAAKIVALDAFRKK